MIDLDQGLGLKAKKPKPFKVCDNLEE